MDTNKIVNGVVGKQSLKGLARDSDGDKVMNVIDCAPNNPNKQGWVHDAAEKVKEKYNDYKAKREIEKESEKIIQQRAKEAAHDAYLKEKEKVVTEKAVSQARERARGSQGGGFSNILGSLSGVSSGTTSSARAMPRRKIVTYKKVGKEKYKKVVSYKSTTPRKLANNQGATANYLFGNSNITKNEMGSMLGTGSKKKGTSVLNMRI